VEPSWSGWPPDGLPDLFRNGFGDGLGLAGPSLDGGRDEFFEFPPNRSSNSMTRDFRASIIDACATVNRNRSS
jgi:hypothetical protein